MGLLDRFKDKPTPARVLEHPRDLLLGDMLDFALMEQQALNNKSFQVTKIWTVDLGGDSLSRTYFQLKDADKRIRLRVFDDDILEIALEVTPDILLEAFDEDDIYDILDSESGVNHHVASTVELNDLPTDLQGWVAKNYRQEGFELAYRYNDDFRHKSLPQYTGAGEQGCDLAWLISDDRKHGLEFCVFDGGRTEAYLCCYIPLRKIEALWPAKQEEE
ncbi:MAG: hypothetical protein GQ582_05070 [Methyloprofundus sp.]|nr:hypothetical protein [Methyloprofundus sp.]